ncbi:hypothetical protein NE237_003126 [Protea cynaroides]|uniref:Eukaryotic translation initiation factor 2 subunit beta n=1 Tax=Protea cynaroides TaxID=273540 RepID=A0A9Q0KGE0_9MAGN|nr:hypothetical protein NE237_003126 [Protea cynaroides]
MVIISLLCQLRDGSSHQGTVTSMEPNEGSFVLHSESSKKGKIKPVHVVDVPGHSRLRPKLDEYLPQTAGLIFVVDAVEFLPNCRAAAEYLYDILTKASVVKKKIPVLILCNKTDKVTAHSKEFIRKQLEKELDKLRASRTAISDADIANDYTLGVTGEPFTFYQCHNKVVTAEASALTGDIVQVEQFIREHRQSKRNSVRDLIFLPSAMTDETPVDVKDDVAELAPFDPTKKKKKKKVVIQDPTDDAVDKLAEKTENLSVSDGLENTFAGMKKKKKKLVETDTLKDVNEDAGEDLDEHVGEEEEGEGIVLGQQFPWEGSDRDYEYEELLGRVFNILRENNPELAGDRRRTVMRPPQVLREGTKKTVFVNFMDLCKTMHRQPEHVMTFLLAEMGTSGSLDGQQRLVIKGRFAPKNFEGILRRYVNEYVICNGCKSPDTILSKENRLFFLRCEQCGSGRSVAPIKAGFVARVGRRKAGT